MARRHAVTQTNPEFVNPKYDIDLSWHGEPDSDGNCEDGESCEYLLTGTRYRGVYDKLGLVGKQKLIISG